MKLIVGLGNPGKKYEGTRHNLGFMALDHYLDNVSFRQSDKFHGLIHETTVNSEKVIFLKPQTYMNNSGQAVSTVSDYFSIPSDQTLVIYDELALPFGTVRTRQGGEAAGHKGIKSLMDHLGNDDFYRLRIGIANKHSQKQAAETFVLKPFSWQEKRHLDKVLDVAEPMVEQFIANGTLDTTTEKIQT